jgi:DNA invertase Pin-like site-specific DNA recombinase
MSDVQSGEMANPKGPSLLPRISRHLNQTKAADLITLFRRRFLMQNWDMTYGSAHVFTVSQDLASQLAQPKAVECERGFREKITGTTDEQPQLKKLMAVLAHGVVVVIPADDRLSRDTTDLLVVASDMQRAGAGLRSPAEPVANTTSDFAELVMAVLGIAAKLERRRINERIARGRADAKANGVKFGCKPKLTPHQMREARKRTEGSETQRSVACR